MGANTTSFVPGKSGNPLGRPPVNGSISYFIKKLADEIPAGGEVPRNEQLAGILWDMATIDKSHFAIALLVERIDGKPPEKLDITQKIEVIGPGVDDKE